MNLFEESHRTIRTRGIILTKEQMDNFRIKKVYNSAGDPEYLNNNDADQMLMNFIARGEFCLLEAINDGKWDASFIKANKSDVGFDFENSPFGNDNFDIIPFENDFKFNQYFTGFIYYTYFPDLRIVSGIKGFIDDDFLPELLRRYELEQCVYKNKVPDIETLKENYNTVIDKTYREEKEDFGKAIKQIEKWLK